MPTKKLSHIKNVGIDNNIKNIIADISLISFMRNAIATIKRIHIGKQRKASK